MRIIKEVVSVFRDPDVFWGALIIIGSIGSIVFYRPYVAWCLSGGACV